MTGVCKDLLVSVFRTDCSRAELGRGGLVMEAGTIIQATRDDSGLGVEAEGAGRF